MWRWDGQNWVPTSAQNQPPIAPKGSRRWIWWVAGGCALLLVLAIGGAVIGGAALVNSFVHGGLTCLPSDFPAYPSASVMRENTYVGTNVAPGDSRDCQMTLESNDNVASVTDFYTSRLSSGDWTIVSNDKSTGEIRFRRTSRPASVGIIALLGRGQHTEIQIRFDS